jgi:hypothetical protein
VIGSEDLDRRVVEAWFRRRGLPLVVRRRSGTALLERTMPALVFLLLIDPLLSGLGVLLAVDDEEFARRTANPGYVIALLTLTVGALVVPVLAGWFLAKAMRRMSERTRRVLAVAVALVVVVLPLVENWSGLRAGVLTHVLLNLVAVPVLLFLVYLGAGSIVSWALRNAVYQLGTVGSLASRALLLSTPPRSGRSPPPCRAGGSGWWWPSSRPWPCSSWLRSSPRSSAPWFGRCGPDPPRTWSRT